MLESSSSSSSRGGSSSILAYLCVLQGYVFCNLIPVNQQNIFPNMLRITSCVSVVAW